MEFSGYLLDPQLILTGFEIKNWYKLPLSKIISRVGTDPQLQWNKSAWTTWHLQIGPARSSRNVSNLPLIYAK